MQQSSITTGSDAPSARDKINDVWSSIRSIAASIEQRKGFVGNNSSNDVADEMSLMTRPSTEDGAVTDIAASAAAIFGTSNLTLETMVRSVLGCTVPTNTTTTTGTESNNSNTTSTQTSGQTSGQTSTSNQRTQQSSILPRRKSTSSFHLRAEDAVNNLRTKSKDNLVSNRPSSTSRRSKSPGMMLQTNTATPSSRLSRPFPVSSPSRRRNSTGLPHDNSRTQHQANDDKGNNIRNNMGPQPPQRLISPAPDDDTISAISAHTLEEMARIEEFKRLAMSCSDLTEDDDNFMQKVATTISKEAGIPREDSSELFDNVDNNKSPYNIGSRNERSKNQRSSGTHNSRHTTRTKQSYGNKTLSTSSTHEFESAWKKEEQKYWEGVANNTGTDEEENRHRLLTLSADSSNSRHDPSLNKRNSVQQHYSKAVDKNQSKDQTHETTTAATSTMQYSSNYHSADSSDEIHNGGIIGGENEDDIELVIEAHRQVKQQQLHSSSMMSNDHHYYYSDPDRIVTDDDVLLETNNSELGEI